MQGVWNFIKDWWRSAWQSNCPACGEFTPSMMQEPDGTCPFCAYERDKLYDEVGWHK